MRRTATATLEADTVHASHAPRPSTIQQQIAASVHQRQAARQILEESRRLSELTWQRLAEPPRSAPANPDS